MKRWKCLVCGEVFESGEKPQTCPVCGADVFEEEGAVAPAAGTAKAERYVIVGGGMAALEAAKEIRKRDAASPITMLSAENHPPYNRPGLSALIASGAGVESLWLAPQQFYADNNIELKLSVTVTAIDAEKKAVVLADGQRIPYTRLLLAAGASPFNPIQRDAGAVPVLVMRRYEDATELAALARGKRVVLVGGGILGLEAAESLCKLGAKVTVVEFAPRMLPLQTEEVASAMLTQKLNDMGIRLICGHSVTAATPRGAMLNDGNELEADLVLASMGVRSRMELAESIGLTTGRGIVVNEYMRTSNPDIWAAGDCAEYNGVVRAMAGAARMMGAVSGAGMAGDETRPYVPYVPATIFNLPGFSLFSAGNISADIGEDIVMHSDGERPYRRLFFQNGGLCGALFVGGCNAGAVMRALAEKAEPQKAAELLF